MIFSQCFYKITSEDSKCFTRINGNGLMFLICVVLLWSTLKIFCSSYQMTST
ncbi:hypothetical protein MTR67_044902 [Solanum verrucosum]|uniref:Uncharacterized protein n=1 Tax=Solanum verrucosum TaxID=315347 RepID=A0AAF0US20_SOLVR|nr:hypothetical protein MTR67_044902 [Solanum verrucosum]